MQKQTNNSYVVAGNYKSEIVTVIELKQANRSYEYAYRLARVSDKDCKDLFYHTIN